MGAYPQSPQSSVTPIEQKAGGETPLRIGTMADQEPYRLSTRRPDTVKREVFEPPHTLLAEIPMIGWADVARAEQALPGHVHADFWEICYIVHGSVDWWVEDEVFELRPGYVYITRPNERHGGVDAVLHPCELYWLEVQFPRGSGSGRGLPGLSAAQTRQLEQSYAALQLRTFPGSTSLIPLYERVMTECRAPTAEGPVIVQSLLSILLFDVLRDYQSRLRHLSDTAGRSRAIQRAIDWMDENIGEVFSMLDAAKAAGLSVSHFRHRFQQETGFNPVEYLTRRRITQAKRLLRTSDRSVTEIAYDLGFSTSQYFATVFRKMVGITPREYRRPEKHS